MIHLGEPILIFHIPVDLLAPTPCPDELASASCLLTPKEHWGILQRVARRVALGEYSTIQEGLYKILEGADHSEKDMWILFYLLKVHQEYLCHFVEESKAIKAKWLNDNAQQGAQLLCWKAQIIVEGGFKD